MLAIGGVIKYELRAGARVSDTFILQHVCPHSTCLLHEKVCIVWAIFGEFSANLDSSYVANIKRAFLVLNPNWADGTNPVKKFIFKLQVMVGLCILQSCLRMKRKVKQVTRYQQE